MKTQVLESYIDNFSAFNEIPPQLESFIKGLKALNSNQVRICKFTFNDLFYTVMVPERYFKGVNFTKTYLKFLAMALLKRDITLVSVYDMQNITAQMFNGAEPCYMSVYNFLRNTYNDKCRHTVIKYYSLDNPK